MRPGLAEGAAEVGLPDQDGDRAHEHLVPERHRGHTTPRPLIVWISAVKLLVEITQYLWEVGRKLCAGIRPARGEG